MTGLYVDHRDAVDSIKEKLSMKTRFTAMAMILGTAFIVLAILPVASASAAEEPWWQVLTGSRPTNMWEPKDASETQEVTGTSAFGVYAVEISVGGEAIGCLGTGSLFGTSADEFCEAQTGFPASEEAEEFEEMLEGSYGAGKVHVSGGPAGSLPFEVVTPWAPPIEVRTLEAELFPGFFFPLGSGVNSKVVSEGSGRLVLTLTNLGDAALDATGTPVTITDQLPAGVVAYGVEASAGAEGSSGPVDCVVKSAAEVVCRYEGPEAELPPFEAIEVEILASLEGSPPVAGAPGEVTVSGGNAKQVTGSQAVNVSDQPVAFGIEQFSAVSEEEGGGSTRRAGSHPFQFTTTLQLNSGPAHQTPPPVNFGARALAIEQPAIPRNLHFPLPAGLVGNPTTAPQCDITTFLRYSNGILNECPDATAVGVASVTVVEEVSLGLVRLAVPVFNLPPAPGEPARFGFVAAGAPVIIDTAVDPTDAYRLVASVRNAPQTVQFLSATTTLWGTPGDRRHDNARGWGCAYFTHPYACQRPAEQGEDAFLRMPVQCSSPLGFSLDLEPWNVPIGSQVDSKSFTSEPLIGCNSVPFDPSVAASPTTKLAENPSGLDFSLKMPNSGLLNKEGIAEGQAKEVEVDLPQGMTINPSQGEGLAGCSPADYARETAESKPGEGCPDASKVGTVQIATPLLKEEAHGSLYVASPHDNPFDSLLALYMVAKIPDRGIVVKQAGKVEPDPVTGQLTTTFDNLPQLPFSNFELHFNEGPRAPLVMPGACGSYDITAKFTPWNAVDPDNPQPNEIVTRTSQFAVDQAPNGTPCPSGTPPFHPGFTAGTENNAAGTYSPFKARLTREDGEQEFSRFSLKLPKGVIGNLSGIPFCSEAAIAQARSRTGVNGGQEELESPSCPAASQIGRTLVGAGVGSALTYVPGKLYLAGPYQGAKLSAVAITPAKVGPFDLGNVVIRQALKVDPVTAEVSTDGSSSDPIPHILQGIVVHARDIRVLVDRTDFVLNPTSCERMTSSASVSGLSAVDVSSPFQAADCASLGFKPKLALSLKGATKRTGHPRLKAVLTARKGDANIREAVVALPHSEFLEQSHIRTICTRVQFNAGGGNGEQCPKGSIYGRVKAVTPLLDEPLSGPVFLRSSNHPLPDLVAALHSGKVDINLDGRIDSINGGIRNSFEAVPDAPVTKFTLEMQGGKKGLLVNSTNICQGKHRASATFIGQNGKRFEANPPLKAKCGGKKKHKKH